MTWTAEQQRRCIEFDEAVEAYVDSKFPSIAPDRPTYGDADEKAYSKWKSNRFRLRWHIRRKKMYSGEWDDVKPYIEKKLNIKPSSKAGVEEEEALVDAEPLNADSMAPSKLPASTPSKPANKGTPVKSRPAPQGGGIEPDAKRLRREPAPANGPPEVNEKELAPARINSARKTPSSTPDRSAELHEKENDSLRQQIVLGEEQAEEASQLSLEDLLEDVDDLLKKEQDLERALQGIRVKKEEAIKHLSNRSKETEKKKEELITRERELKLAISQAEADKGKYEAEGAEIQMRLAVLRGL